MIKNHRQQCRFVLQKTLYFSKGQQSNLPYCSAKVAIIFLKQEFFKFFFKKNKTFNNRKNKT